MLTAVSFFRILLSKLLEVIILTKEEYDNLVNEVGKAELFINSLNEELNLKFDDIQAYKQIGSKDIVNKLQNQYTGMLLARDIFRSVKG